MVYRLDSSYLNMNFTATAGDGTVVNQNFGTTPIYINVSHTELKSSQSHMIVVFNEFQASQNHIDKVAIEEVDADVNVLKTIQLSTIDYSYNSSSKQLLLKRAFHTNTTYKLVLRVKVGFYVFEINGLVVPLDVVHFNSEKRFYTVDALSSTNQVLFDCLHFIYSEPDFAAANDWDYAYNWDVRDSLSVNVATVDTKKFNKKLARVEDCYSVDLIIRPSGGVPAKSKGEFCTRIGINATIAYESAIKRGAPSLFQIHVADIGKDSCIAFDTGDGTSQLYAFYTSIGLLNHQKSLCSGRISNVPDSHWLVLTSHNLNEYKVVVNHTYTSTGDFNIKLIALNQIHEQQEPGIQSILDVDCEAPVIDLLGKIFFFLFRCRERGVQISR